MLLSVLLSVSVRRLLLSVAVVGGVSISLNAGAMHAQGLPGGENSVALLPLQPMSVTVPQATLPLDVIFPEKSAAIADKMNAQMADARAQPEEPAGFSLDQLPIVGDLVDEKGDFDWGIDLPVSVNVSNFLGAYGVTVEMDFRL